MSRTERSETLDVPVAAPPSYTARRLSDPEDRELVERWTSQSPDSSLHNTSSYVDFARAANGRGELLWLVKDGHPVVGVPLHPAGWRRFTTGYSGVLFPAGPAERALRRGVAAIGALLQANRGMRLHILQSIQARGYDTPGRAVALARWFDESGAALLPLYSRVLDLTDPDSKAPTSMVDVNDLLLNGFEPYRPELRNQIRRAIGKGLRCTIALPGAAVEAREAYAEFVPLHRTSWQRTGMNPHDEPYWLALSKAVIDGGGRDLIVFARDEAGAPLAAATCHIRDDSALYWAGCSTNEGLRANANPLCLHAAIQACRQLGVRRFELGRFRAREPVEKERAITKYKAQFGGELVCVVGCMAGRPLEMRIWSQVGRLRTWGAGL